MLRWLAVCCATISFPAVRALAKPAPPAAEVTIDSIDYHGDGCAKGTAMASVSPDAQAFTVGFSQFDADVGQGTGASSRKCSLHIKLTIPPGWSYALASVDYIGYASLDAGITASRQSTFHISGESPETTAASTFQGGFDGDYAVNAVANAPLYWSRCGKGKNLMITTALAVDNRANPDGSGLITIDAVDGEVYHLVWERCQ